MKPILKTNNNITQPIIGSVYKDTKSGATMVYDGVTWLKIIPLDPENELNFKMFIANDISYAKITSHKWWKDNCTEIHQWLCETTAGYYIEELNTISFFDHKFATLFKLKWFEHL